MGNTVTLTFAGDPAPATTAFDAVGDSSRHMSDQLDDASSAYGKAGEAADGAEQRARGFSDTLAGSADVASGFGSILKGDVFGGLVTVGTGLADVAGGFNDFLLPALEKTRIGTLAKAAADRVAAAGAKVWAGSTWLMNTALLASPITWIVLGITALVAVIVLVATKTDWFKNAWSAAWRVIKSAALAVWDWLKTLPELASKAFDDLTGYITKPFGEAWDWVKKTGGDLIDWFKTVPSLISTALKNLTSLMTAPFRLAFNAVADIWNRTIGGFRVTIPKIVPKIGGTTIAIPKMPKFHAGGVVPGVVGAPVPVLALGGERIQSPAAGPSAGSNRVLLGSDGSRLGDALLDLIATAMRARGGDPAQLGIKTAGVSA